MRIFKWTDHNFLRYFQKRSPNVLSKCSTCRVRRSSAGWQLWGAHCAWPEGDDTFAKNHLTSGVTDVQTGKSLPSAPCCLRNERGPPKKCRKSLEKNRNGKRSDATSLWQEQPNEGSLRGDGWGLASGWWAQGDAQLMWHSTVHLALTECE